MSGGLVSLLRLVRASIALSPLADGLAGMTLACAAGAALQPGPVAFGLLASLCLFLFGMSQNDLLDRNKDRIGRPERPIPSGAISLPQARLVVAGTAGLALACTIALGPTARWLVIILLSTITLYNALPRHGGPLGPILLAAIRTQNLLLGAAVLGRPEAALAVAVCTFAYVGTLSLIARLEDGEIRFGRQRLRGLSWIAAMAALAAPLAATLHPGTGTPIDGLLGFLVAGYLVLRIHLALRSLPATDAGLERFAGRTVGVLLSGLFLYDAAVCFAAGGTVAGTVVLLLFPLSRQLVTRFPPT